MAAKAPEAPVFRPTLQEVNGMTFVEYVEKMEKNKAFREAGICKIVAPDGWAPRRTGYNRLNLELPRCGCVCAGAAAAQQGARRSGVCSWV
jgi:jumonji domain-containing protein 2